ncbi:MAG: FtsX-like permease family protein [Dehalococcoidia bacterium]|nr:FtsX-like permease family protein [Dehalococcoidia bacterium]
MRSLLPIWNLVTRRAASNRLLLSVLALGVLIASILLASAPIYARTMSDLGLTFSIREELPSGPGTRVIVRDVPISEAGDPLREAVSGRVQDRIGWFTRATELFERTGPIPVGKPGEERPANGPAVQLQSLTGWEPHVAVTDGALPSGFDSEGRLEVAIDPQSAEFMELQPGDPIELRESIDDCEQAIVEGDGMPTLSPCPDGTPTLAFDYTIPAVVSGIVQPLDPESEFWIAGLNQYFRFQRNSPIANPTFSAWIEPGTFTGEFAERYPGYAVDVTWNAYANPEAINQATLDRARVDLDGLRIETQSVDGITASPVANVLDRFATESSYRQAPLTILLLQVAAIALFYVALAAGVVVDRQSPEIALLRSRGASIRQVLTVYMLEGLIIGVPVLLLAPFIAAALTSVIGLLPVFEDVSGGELLPATVTPAAFGYAAIGVGLSLLAVLVPAFVIARRSAVAQRRVEARPGKPFFQRFYLDFVLVGFAALLLWELNERGSAFQPSPTGGVSSDPVLLASPALIIVAGAALLMRFVPIIMRLLGRLVVPAAGASLAGAFWQLVRSPGQYMRLAILLMMAIAVGTFAASYSSTADRSYRDRANFQAGVDLRGLNMSRFTNLGSIPEAEEQIANAEGVDDASMVLRTDASPATSGAAGRSIDVLGVDPEAVAPMLYTRDDFADESIESLLFGLRGQPAYEGIELPANTSSLSIWAHTAEPRESVTFWARPRFRGSNRPRRVRFARVPRLDPAHRRPRVRPRRTARRPARAARFRLHRAAQPLQQPPRPALPG